jgi:hypothetical protein
MRPITQTFMTATYNADSMASVTMRWQDIPNEASYYLCAVYKNKLGADEVNGDGLQFDFTLDDRIGDGEMFTIATLFEYEPGDTIIAMVYHIAYDYWRYMNSLDDASSSNGNPFAQPGVIHSNLDGGLGIFTGFQARIDTFYVP